MFRGIGCSVRTGREVGDDAFCRPGNCHSPESYLTGLHTDAAAAWEAGSDGGRGVAPDLMLHGGKSFLLPGFGADGFYSTTFRRFVQENFSCKLRPDVIKYIQFGW